MNKRLLELDALRGIAAIIVVLFHINLFYPFFKSNLMDGVFKYGASGVDLFFMISGFVIAWTLEKTNTWKDFVISRFARLYPSYWICVTLTAICIIIDLADTHRSYSYIISEYLPNMTMFQRFFNVKDIDDVYWTLTVEMVFYIFMFIVFATKKLKYVEYISLVTVLLLFVFNSSYFSANYGNIQHVIHQYLPITMYFPLFLMGITYYKMKFDRPTVFRYVVIVVCVLCQLSFCGKGLKSDLFINPKNYLEITIVYNAVFLLFIYNKLSFIVNKITLFLGSISYPLYLVHYYLSVYVIIPTLIILKVPAVVAALTAFVIAVVLATIISYTVEKPANKYLRKRFSAKQVMPVDVAISGA